MERQLVAVDCKSKHPHAPQKLQRHVTGAQQGGPSEPSPIALAICRGCGCGLPPTRKDSSKIDPPRTKAQHDMMTHPTSENAVTPESPGDGFDQRVVQRRVEEHAPVFRNAGRCLCFVVLEIHVSVCLSDLRARVAVAFREKMKNESNSQNLRERWKI